MNNPSFLNQRYRLVKILGKNPPFGVFLVEDHQKDNRLLALKCIYTYPSSEKIPSHFQQEFRILSQLHHPHIARVHDFEKLNSGREHLGDLLGQNKKNGDFFFYTMDYIEGSDFFSATENRTLEEILLLTLQLSSTLDYLHRNQFIHRDLKPDNIIVDPIKQQITLVDFGLTCESRFSCASEISGTLEYLPPEAFFSGELDKRSDLYSLGLTLFKIFTRTSLFEVETPAEIIAQHKKGIESKIKILLAKNPSIPKEVSQFIISAVQKDPWKRPLHLFLFLEAISKRLNQTSFSGDFPSILSQPPPLGDSNLIAREETLEKILYANPPYPKSFLIHGEFGCGKTRFLKEIHHRAQLMGKKSLYLDAHDLKHHSLFAVLYSFLEKDSQEQNKNTPPLDSFDPLDQSHAWHRECRKIVEKFIQNENAFLLCVDDLDQTRPDNREMLEYLLRMLASSQKKSALQRRPLLFLGAQTNPQASTGKTANVPWKWTRYTLSNFNEVEAAQVLQEWLGQKLLPPNLMKYLFPLTLGNPFLLRTETEELLRQKSLLWKDGHYLWEQPKSPERKTPEKIRNVFLDRFEIAPENFKFGLKSAAIFPDGFSIDDLDSLYSQKVDIYSFLDWAIKHLFLKNQGDNFYFCHEGFRQFLLEECSPQFLTKEHLRAAQKLQKQKSNEFGHWSRLAYHFKGAQFHDEAIQAFQKGANAAERKGDFSAAAPCLAQAIDLSQDGNLKRKLKLHLAKILISMARYDEACESLKDILDQGNPINPENLEILIEAIHSQIQILSRRGKYKEAISLFQKFNLEIQNSEKNLNLRSYTNLLGQVGQCLIRHGELDDAENILNTALKNSRKNQDRLAEIVIECHQGELALQRGYLKPSKQIYRRTLKRITQSQKRRSSLKGIRLAASVHNNLGKISAKEGKDDIALKHFKESIDLAKQIGNPAEECISLIHLGNIFYRQNRFEESKNAYSDSLDLCQLVYKPREEAINLFNLGNIHFMLGQYPIAIDFFKRALLIHQEQEDPAAIANCFAALAIVHLEIGDLSEARGSIEESEMALGKRNLEFQRAYLQLLHGIADRIEAKYAAAREHFRIAESQFKSLGNSHELAQTHVEWSEMEAQDSSTPSKDHAKNLAHQALEVAKIHRADDLMVQAQLVLAQIQPEESFDLLTDAEKRAKKAPLNNLLWKIYLQKAAFLAQDSSPQSSSGEIARYLRLARTCLENNSTGLDDHQLKLFWNDPRHAIGTFHQPRNIQNIPQTSVKEMTVRFRNEALGRGIGQLSNLFQINDLLNSQTDLNSLLEFIMDTAISLIRAQRGLIILKKPTGEVNIECARKFNKSQLAEPETAFSYSIALATMKDNRTMMTQDALIDQRFANEFSVNHLKLRSVLCAPLRVQNKVLGAVYLDNSRRKGAFTDEDTQLLEIVANQAALAIENARLRRKLEEQIELQNVELRDARRQLKSRYNYDGIIGGASSKMREVFQVLDKIIDSDMPVIIQGESGTGKELVARAIHYNGPFSHGKFVSENCAALPSQLLESILFGHEKGAFTGAHQNRKGLFEVASGGTLFLDEIGEMSPAMQVKILRAIQEGEIRPLGANYSIHVKVRIISASNQNLQDLVHNGKFRKDLYYRLRGIDIHLPPLRERREDIPLLVKHFLKEFSEGKMKISRAAARLLYHYNWPGNIQEMRNSLERATLICGQGEIQAEDLPEEIRGHQKPSLPKGTLPFLEAKKQFERNYLTDLLQVHSGNITRAATATGLYRQYLHRLLKKHKLQ